MINKSLFAVVFCLFISLPVLADIGDITRIQLETTSWTYQSGIGGEFRGTIIGDSIDIGGNSIDKGYQWITFCLEKDETVEGSTSDYWAYVNNEALRGGINTNYGDPLSSKTAYLYTQFATEKLSGYRYDGTEAERKADASELQEVIWYIEGEAEILNGKASEWYNEALEAKWTDIGNVRVLNLYDHYYNYKCYEGFDGYRQDVLIYVESVPVPAAALLGTLGMAIAGMKLRKFA